MSSTTATVSRYARRRSGSSVPEEREQPERERRVGRHRGSPAVRRAVARVDGEVDRDRHDHPGEPGEQRESDAPPLAQLAEVELPPGLEPDHEEEERHQAGVDPAAEVLRDAAAPDPDRERRRPDALVGRQVDVRPDERRDDRGEEYRSAARLRPEEAAERRLQVARPRRPPAERGRGNVRLGHRLKLRTPRRFDRGARTALG